MFRFSAAAPAAALWLFSIWVGTCIVVQAQDTTSTTSSFKLDVQLLARNLGSPVDLFVIPGDTSGRRFILEQDGRILIMEPDNSVDPLTPFMNIQDRVLGLVYPFDERGMIGVAFHPNYSSNGLLYVRYTANKTEENICYGPDGTVPTNETGCPNQHSSILAEFKVSDDNPNIVNTTSERILMRLENPSGRNIGAGLAFGPDGYLYTGFGDGGGIYGPGNADGSGYADASEGVSEALYFYDLWPQNLTNDYGKVHRIDVNTRTDNLPYGIPPSNPWANNTEGYRKTIYAWGFRNPYSLSFDRLFFINGTQKPSNGHYPFWISSSSETLFDGTTLVDEPGNYGWAVMQGSHCFSRKNPLVPPDTVSCTTNADCNDVNVYGQVGLCGEQGVCSCRMVDAYGYTMKPPVIEYVNNNAAERPTAEALVEAGLIGMPKGRTSLGGYVYRGTAIPWLIGKFVNGDFAVEELDGQIQIATDPMNGTLPWPFEVGFVFDPASEEKAGFMKAIGEDAFGELYAITGEFDEFFQIDGRIYKIVDASITDDSPAVAPNATAPVPAPTPATDTPVTAPMATTNPPPVEVAPTSVTDDSPAATPMATTNPPPVGVAPTGTGPAPVPAPAPAPVQAPAPAPVQAPAQPTPPTSAGNAAVVDVFVWMCMAVALIL